MGRIVNHISWYCRKKECLSPAVPDRQLTYLLRRWISKIAPFYLGSKC